jgi:lipoprotein-anchoring transpeptidase ErfK/SrfK
MLRAEDQIRKLAVVTGAVLLAAAEALAQNEASRPARRVVVSIPHRKLAVLEAGHVVRTYSVAVGKPSTPSPIGSFRVVQRIPDPTWYTRGRIVPPGKSNPLGTRWIGLDVKGYGIHGTNRAGSIGRNVSHGCVRLRNSDVEELFNLLAVGDTVELMAESTPELESLFAPVLVAQAGASSAR